MHPCNKLTISISLILLSLALVFAVACGANQPGTSPVPAKGAPSSAQTPGRGGPSERAGAPITPSPAAPTRTPIVSTAVSKVKVAGTLVAVNQATLTFAMSGRLKELPVPEGTPVKAGTLLAALDTTTLELQVAQAKAALDLATTNWNTLQAGPTADAIALAKSNLDRAKAAVDQAQAAYDRIGGQRNPFSAMSAQGAALQQATLAYQIALAQYNLAVNHPTEAERAIGMAQLAQAQAAYDVARQNLNNARILAPFDGTIVSITPKIGESVSAFAPVMVFADLTQMQVLTSIDETTLANIKVGQAAAIFVDALQGKSLTGRVKRIGLFATSTGNVVTVPVWIEIDKTSTALSPGWSATVEIVTRP